MYNKQDHNTCTFLLLDINTTVNLLYEHMSLDY